MGAKTFGTDVANNLSTMKGKYVKYPAGAWSYDLTEVKKWMGTDDVPYTNVSSPITVAPNAQGMFGGILLGTWAATGIDVATGGEDAQYKDANGNWAWQILGATVVDGKTCATLMTTYITEEYYQAVEASTSANLLNGQNARKFRIYENLAMAVTGSGHAMTKAEADSLSQSQRAAITLPGMASMSSSNYYWLGTVYNQYRLYYADNTGTIGDGYGNGYCYGVRPVVTLKSDILYSGSGTAEDPYVVGYSE